MNMIKNMQSTDHSYEAPSCRVYYPQMQCVLCVSAGALPPVVEEDAGIGEWGH